MKEIKWFFKSLLTDTDNNAYDIMRVLVFIGSVVFLIISLQRALTRDEFNLVDFATAYAAIIASGGLGIGAKTKFEEQATLNELKNKKEKDKQKEEGVNDEEISS